MSGRPGLRQTFTCPNGASYSCSLGTRGCMEPFNPACCSSDLKGCPYLVTRAGRVGQQKIFTCPDGATYKCSPGSEQGCVEPINEACCLLGAGHCPFKVNRPHPPPPYRPELDFEVCACATLDACPSIIRACQSAPENPLCADVLPFCNWVNQENDNRTEGYVSNAIKRAGM